MKDGICPCEEGALCRFVCRQCRILYAHVRGQNHPNRSICVSAIKWSQMIRNVLANIARQIPQVGDEADLLLLGPFHSGEANEHLAR